MIFWVHVLATVLSSWRLTELFASDRITAKLREKIPSYLWTCPRCLSIWAGIAATGMFLILPWLNWPLALAWLYLWHNDAIVFKRLQKSRQLWIEVGSKGDARILRSELSPQEIQSLLNQFVAR